MPDANVSATARKKRPQDYVGDDCTLDGKPATIVGKKRPMATVIVTESNKAYRFAWQTVRDVMENHNGEFKSIPRYF